jgi:hypothetical protein
MGLRDENTDYTIFATGTEAQRPQTPEAGMIRHNTDEDALETYNGTSWEIIGDQERRIDGSASDRASFSAQRLIDDGYGNTNGYYWITFNGTEEPKQIYCDVTGNEAGSGYMRIDSAWAQYYSGDACNSGYGTVGNDGLMKVSANSGGGGSGSHGGCGIFVNTPFYARYFKVNNVSFTPNGNWGGPQFPNPYFSVMDAENTSTLTNFTDYYYPGWNPERTAEYGIYNAQGLGQNWTYDMGDDKFRYMHFGVGAFSGGFNRPCEMKVWFKPDANT